MNSDKARQLLLAKQQQVKEQLKSIESNDPVLSFADLANEAQESGTEVWQSDVHFKSLVLIDSLNDLSSQIDKALLNVKDGSYGKCEKCHVSIPKERLVALPSASFCAKCAQDF